MREALKNAVQSAILFECQLPHQESGLGKSCLSSQNDICFNNTDPQEIRFLYKGIIIKHNKTEPTYTKTSLFLCEKRRFFMARTEKGVVATI